MSKKMSYYERFMAMTDAQRSAEVAPFDEEHVGLRGKPLTAAQKALHRRAKRKAGRAKATGNGTARVSVTIELHLLERADAYAKANRTSRSQLIAKGLAAVIR